MPITETPFLISRICTDYAMSGVNMSPRAIIRDLTSRYRLIKSPEVMGWFTAGLMNALITDLNSSPNSQEMSDGSMISLMTINHDQAKGFLSQAAIYLKKPHHYRVGNGIIKNYRDLSRISLSGDLDLWFLRSLGRYDRYKDHVALDVGALYVFGRFQDFLTIAFGMSPNLTTNVFMSIFKSSINNL